LSTLPGSKIALTAAMTSMASAEYMAGSSSLRARPSPCSPDIEPPYVPTSCAAATTNRR